MELVSGAFQHGNLALLVLGLVICGLVALYLGWHLFFMLVLPIRRVFLGRVSEVAYGFRRELGVTLADGGEKLKEGKEKQPEEKEG